MSMKQIGISGFCRELDYATISSIFFGVLEEIDLSNNNITTLVNTSLADCIEEDFSLRCLYMANNHLNDFDARSIARALKNNEQLSF